MRILLLLSMIFLIGCATTYHQSLYTKQLVEIEQAYIDKKISYAEYLNLKDNVEDARQQRKVTVLAAYIGKQY